MAKIHKGDTVKIILGKDSGKTGKVMGVDPKDKKVILEGLNLLKKHVRPKKKGEKGEIVQVPRPIDISNVMLVCGSCKKPVRISFRLEANKKKERICKKCGAVI